jgi:hypothetical protein
MNLFGRNEGKAARPRMGDASRHLPAQLDAGMTPPYRMAPGLSRAETFAVMLAHSRAARMVEIADLLAGIYIHDWERIAKYWKDEDQEKIESYLRQICRISPQRWHFWIELYHNQQHPQPAWRKWRLLERFLDRESPAEELPRRSAALAAALEEAERIAPFQDTFDGPRVPILSSECVLLCIARDTDSEISRKLAEAGMDLTALARDVLFPSGASSV